MQLLRLRAPRTGSGYALYSVPASLQRLLASTWGRKLAGGPRCWALVRSWSGLHAGSGGHRAGLVGGR